MMAYQLILVFSYVAVVTLLFLLGYKSYLHYQYLWKLKKISNWKSLVLFPLVDLGGVISITLPFFFTKGNDEIMEGKINQILKIFWISFMSYFILIFIFIIIFIWYYGKEGVH
jgi:hypothetical protein